MDYARVPRQLTRLPQWVNWIRNKIPTQPNGKLAKTNDPKTWHTFDQCVAAVGKHGILGIGIVISKKDNLLGLDLDNCIDRTGIWRPWATTICDKFAAYTEISPSGRGAKIFCSNEKQQLPWAGKRIKYEDGAIEAYQAGRYFTVTGHAVGSNADLREVNGEVDWLLRTYFKDKTSSSSSSSKRYKQALKSVQGLPPSVEGRSGSAALYCCCCEILRFGITGHQAKQLLDWYNANSCRPRWSEAELAHKWEDATTEIIRSVEFGCRLREYGQKTKEEDKREFRLKPISGTELIKTRPPIRYLCQDVLVEGQPMLVGGPPKVLKTSFLIDLAISLSEGAPFLGHFQCPKPVRTLLISGESGEGVIGETVERISASREVKPNNCFFDFRLPAMTDKQHLQELSNVVRDIEIKVLCLDPAYLSMLSGSKVVASDVFAMGGILLRITELCDDIGITLVLAHHTNKAASNRGRGREDAPDLSELSMSGFAEWARQWIMLARRDKYAGNGLHNLVMGVGGAAGHGGDYRVHVDEGVEEFIGRRWRVAVQSNDDTDYVAELLQLMRDSGYSLDRIRDEVWPGYTTEQITSAINLYDTQNVT